MRRTLLVLVTTCATSSFAHADDKCHVESHLEGHRLVRPKIAHGAGRFLVSWRPLENYVLDPHVAILSSDTTILTEQSDYLSSQNYSPESFVGYPDGFVTFGERGVEDLMWRLDADGALSGEPVVLTNGESVNKIEGVFDGDAFVLAWMPGSDVYMARMQLDGTISAPMRLGSGPPPHTTEGSHRLLVETSGEVTWILWLQSTTPAPRYVGIRVARDGTVLDSPTEVVYEGSWPGLTRDHAGGLRVVGWSNDDQLTSRVLADDGTLSDVTVWETDASALHAIVAVGLTPNGYRLVRSTPADDDPRAAAGSLSEQAFDMSGVALRPARTLVPGAEGVVAVHEYELMAAAATLEETAKGNTSTIVVGIPNAYGDTTVLDESAQTKVSDKVCGCAATGSAGWLAGVIIVLGAAAVRRSREHGSPQSNC